MATFSFTPVTTSPWANKGLASAAANAAGAAASPISETPRTAPPATPILPRNTTADSANVIQYAREIGGAPDQPGSISETLRKDLGGIPNRLMGAVNRVGDQFANLGNALMGNEFVVRTPDGPINVTRDVMIDAGAELAGLVGGAGSLVERPAGSLGVLGGPRSRTADLWQLERAQRFEAERATPEEIWQDTGWERGADKMWKYEISDAGSKFDENALQPWRSSEPGIAREIRQRYNYGELSERNKAEVDEIIRRELGISTTVGEALEHPELYRAYPSLRDVPLERVERDDLGGYYDPENNLIAMTPKGADVSHMRGEEGHGVLMHEIQHGIQSREGFAHGGAPTDPEVIRVGEEIKSHVVKRAEELKKKISNSPIVDENDVAEYATLVKVLREVDASDAGRLGYQSLAGEVEARNVEHRLSMSKNYVNWGKGGYNPLPQATEDTSRAIQWVRRPKAWLRTK